MDNRLNQKLTVESVFDDYDNILDVGETRLILSHYPFICKRFHRMAYFTHHRRSLKALKVYVLPFLHERRLYLNRMAQFHKYFYFTFDQK
jgi:hypothetical protein